jgi:hypothetical protein
MTPLTPEERARGPLYLLRYIDEQSAEIERLNVKLETAGLIIAQCGADWINAKQLITELCDALEEEFGESRDLTLSQQRPWNLIQRAREATR